MMPRHAASVCIALHCVVWCCIVCKRPASEVSSVPVRASTSASSIPDSKAISDRREKVAAEAEVTEMNRKKEGGGEGEGEGQVGRGEEKRCRLGSAAARQHSDTWSEGGSRELAATSSTIHHAPNTLFPVVTLLLDRAPVVPLLLSFMFVINKITWLRDSSCVQLILVDPILRGLLWPAKTTFWAWLTHRARHCTTLTAFPTPYLSHSERPETHPYSTCRNTSSSFGTLEWATLAQPTIVWQYITSRVGHIT